MTTLKLDDYLSMILPWELSIEIEGVAFATRAPTLGDVAVIEGAESGKVSLAQMRKVAESLFDVEVRGQGSEVGSQRPDFDRLPIEALVAILMAVMNHWNESQKKTMPRWRKAMEAGAGTGSMSGR